MIAHPSLAPESLRIYEAPISTPISRIVHRRSSVSRNDLSSTCMLSDLGE